MSHQTIVVDKDEKQLEELFSKLQNDQILGLKVPAGMTKRFWVVLIPGNNYKSPSRTFAVTFTNNTTFYFQAYISLRAYPGTGKFWIHFFINNKTREYGVDKFLLKALNSVKVAKKRQVEEDSSDSEEEVVLYDEEEKRPMKKRDVPSEEVHAPAVDSEVELLAMEIIISCNEQMQHQVGNELRQKYEREFAIVKPSIVNKFNQHFSKEYNEKIKNLKERVIQKLTQEFDEKNGIIMRMQSQQLNPFVARMSVPDIAATDLVHLSDEENLSDKFLAAQAEVAKVAPPSEEMLANANKLIMESDTILQKAKIELLKRWDPKFKAGIFQTKTNEIRDRIQKEYEVRLEALEQQYKAKYHDEIYTKKTILKEFKFENKISLTAQFGEKEQSIIDKFLLD